MADAAPLWSVLVLVPAVVAVAFATAAAEAVAEQRTAAAATAPLRDAVRLLVQQRRTVVASDALLRRVGVAALPVAALLAAVVLPLGFQSVDDLPAGVVWFNALEVFAWAAVWATGWGANSAFSLVGGYRFVAQGLAYELPHMLALITAALAAGSLRIGAIVGAQSHVWFAAWMPVAFVLYLVSAVSMAFWGPFSHPLAADAAGGVAAELSGVDRLLFFAGRRLLLVVAVALAVPLFLGGGHGPLLTPWLWTIAKTAALLAFVLWASRKLPALRMERYAELAWVVLVPVAIVQALAVSLVVLTR
jgi:NADH-quinone oxidoreductase subunit H